MQIALVYLGLLLVVGACYMYMRYSLKQMNSKISDILELTNTLAQELETVNRVTNYLGKVSEGMPPRGIKIMDDGVIMDVDNDEYSDVDSDENSANEEDDGDDGDNADNDTDDDSDDDDNEVENADNKINTKLEIHATDIIESKEIGKELDLELLTTKNIKANIDSEEQHDFSKYTVSELKTKIKERNPSTKVTNLKRNELLNILENEC
tara:strand:- start:3180 stop:3806 length:627 start_codon:yes stop_codon:yes gene_type:complete